MVDDRVVADRGVRPPNGFRHIGMGHGQAPDVSLVDDAVVVLVTWWAVVAPVKERVDDHGEHGVTERVRVIELGGVAGLVGVQGAIAVDLTVDGLGVRVQQQL